MINYVSIDLETTGLNPDYCQILEFGAIIDNGENIHDLPFFAAYIINDPIVGQPFALQMNQQILKNIALRSTTWSHNYLYPKELAPRFHDFLKGHGYTRDTKITVAGKNFAGFDDRFLSKLPNWTKHIRTRQRVLDPGPLYWKPKTDGFVLPDLQECMRRADIKGEVQHNAIDDAMVVVKLIRKYLEQCDGL